MREQRSAKMGRGDVKREGGRKGGREGGRDALTMIEKQDEGAIKEGVGAYLTRSEEKLSSG